jgi:hypothetical protein
MREYFENKLEYLEEIGKKLNQEDINHVSRSITISKIEGVIIS